MIRLPHATALACACSVLVTVAPVRAPAAPAPQAAVALPSLKPGRRDAAFALAAAAAAALVSTQDRRWSAEATANHTHAATDLADAGRRLGEPLYVGGALLAVDLAARAAHSVPVAAASERVAGSVVAAGAAALVVKELVGRERPNETTDPGRFKPLTSHDSFPSGHATVAFAFAAALTAETHSRWVTALAWPAAAVTAWSRVHDRYHWPSDVVAGAAVGAGVALRADAYARARWPHGLPLAIVPAPGGGSVALRAAF